MSAQPVPTPPTGGWFPDPVRQRLADFKIDEPFPISLPIQAITP